MTTTVSPTGFTVLYQPHDTPVNIDIVFVHGLQGHPWRTWLYDGPATCQQDKPYIKRKRFSVFRSSKPESNPSVPTEARRPVYWPLDLLPQECPSARILTYGYDTSVTKGYASVDKGNVFSHAKDLLFAFDRCRDQGRRVIFVAHSLGGIIVKEALRRSDDPSEPRLRDILLCTTAIVFLGTPHRGSPGLASTADAVRRVAGAVLQVDTNSRILRSLGVDGPELELCRESFITQWRVHNFTVKTFQEAKGLTGLGVGFLNEKVVPDTSSSLDDPREHAESIPANHMDMVRFWGRDDPGYQKVGLELSRLASSTPSSYSQECLQALSFEDMDNRVKAIKAPMPDTCEWLFIHPLYVSWVHRTDVQSNGGLLWIKGKPGSGKSTLMKEAVHRTRYAQLPRTVISSFFFNGRGSELEHSELGLYRSLILQLCRGCEIFQSFVVSRYRNALGNGSQGWPGSVDELQDMLSVGLLQHHNQQTIIFIDALDECEESRVRAITRYFRALADKVFAAGKILNICLSSRHYPTVVIPRCPEIVVESANSIDISRYIHASLSYDLMSEKSLVDHLRSLLLQKTSGVFLWVVLVVDMVLRDAQEGKTAEEIEENLRAVPEDLAALFRGLLQKLTPKEREASLVLVQWVLLSPCPLQAVDVRAIQVLGIESIQSMKQATEKFQHPEALSHSWNTDAERVHRNVRTLSRGLMEITGSKVQFIHESVRQFFLQESTSVFGGPGIIPAGHAMIVRACLHGLCLLECLKSNGSRETLSFDWILGYTEGFILYHARQAGRSDMLPSQLFHILQQVVIIVNSRIRLREVSSLARTTVAYLAKELSPPNLYSVFIPRWKLFDWHLFTLSVNGATICNRIIIQLRNSTPSCTQTRTESILSLLSIDSLAMDDSYSDMGSRPYRQAGSQSNHDSLSPLASFSGILKNQRESQAAVDSHRLLSNGADINAKDAEGNTALHLAAWQGFERVTDTLLQHHAAVNSVNEYGMTPLLLACLYGRHRIAEKLLAQGADPSLADYDGNTPLHVAVEISNQNLVELLINAGGDVHAFNSEKKVPLHLAVQYGADEYIARMLCLADPEMEDNVKERVKNTFDPETRQLRHLHFNIRKDLQQKSSFGGTSCLYEADKRSLTPLMIADHLSKLLESANPREISGGGSSTNFEKMLASRASNRLEDHENSHKQTQVSDAPMLSHESLLSDSMSKIDFQ